MEDIKLLTDVLEKCEEKLEKNSSFTPTSIVKEEIEYLIGLIEGEVVDPEKLTTIQMGLFAVREFEMEDPEFADNIYEVLAVVTQLRKRYNV